MNAWHTLPLIIANVCATMSSFRCIFSSPSLTIMGRITEERGNCTRNRSRLIYCWGDRSNVRLNSFFIYATRHLTLESDSHECDTKANLKNTKTLGLRCRAFLLQRNTYILENIVLAWTQNKKVSFSLSPKRLYIAP